MINYSGLRIPLVSILIICGLNTSSQVIIQNFTCSGSTQTFITPYCSSQLTISVRGAAGGAGGWGGGNGGALTVAITPTPGMPIYINTGGSPTGTAGGFNGGGTGGVGSSSSGAGGGGASDIRI